jgi:hypothetical protein
LVANPDAWCEIIPNTPDGQPWSNDGIKTFQRLIDLRALDLYENILTDSGIEKILTDSSRTPLGPDAESG